MSQPPSGIELADSPVRRMLHALSLVAGPLIGLTLVLAIFGFWQPRTFLSAGAFRNVFDSNYHLLIAAVGATFVIVSGGIDLSVGSNMAMASVICAMAASGFAFPIFNWQQSLVIAGGISILIALCVAGRGLQNGWTAFQLAARSLALAAIGAIVAISFSRLLAGHTFQPLPVPLALLIGVASGMCVGAMNGALVTSLSLPPFIITLASMGAVRGLTLYITGGLPVSLPTAASDALSALHYQPLLWTLSPNLWITILVLVTAIPLLHGTILGRYAFAIGSNERTARLCGVHVERWKTACYVIAGATAGLAGAMMTATLGGRPSNFEGLELNAIAAVVIGGTSLFGGEGTVVGSALGVLMLGFLNTGCTLADLSSYVQPIFIGFTIVIAAAIDRFRSLAE